MLDSLSEFFGSFLLLLDWNVLAVMLLGIGIGFVVGILPGLGGGVALAMLIPFTFDMEPFAAFAFLLAMLAVTGTTGDITSILFGVPGEVSATATIVDGHPMARSGRAGRALGAALMSSLMGALVGAFALAISIPVIRPLVLSLGAPEFLALVIVGLTFIAQLSSKHPIRGYIAAGVGLLLATVGLAPQTGSPRFTFGSLELFDGVTLIAVAIGLYGIPEIIDLARGGGSIAAKAPDKLDGVLAGVKDALRHWGLVLRSGLIGVAVGVIPGLGGSVSQWIAYGHAVQSAKDQSQFGKGDVRGVLGPGAANNAKEGGGLIPTVAFGVPGSLVFAILIGAFLIHGLEPGPRMLTENLDITLGMVWILVVANLITVAIALVLLKPIARVTQVRVGIIIPFLILFVFIGAYAAQASLFDLGMVLLFGALGWVMQTLDWPRAPLVLGLVLGSLAEEYMFLSIQRYEWAWLGRPGVVVLLGVAALVALSPLIRKHNPLARLDLLRRRNR